MNNPINTNAFRFFFEFVDRNTEKEIDEPSGFDKSNFVAEKDKGSLATNVYYGNSELPLIFFNSYGRKLTTPVMNNEGVLIYHLEGGARYLIEEDELNGSESNVNFIIELDGVRFNVGKLDFKVRKTDKLTYFDTVLTNESEKQNILNRRKTTVNLYATENLDDLPITAMPTVKVLQKAKPQNKASKWLVSGGVYAIGGQSNVLYAGVNIYTNPSNSLVKADLLNSLVPFNPNPLTFNSAKDNFSYLEANNELTNLTITIDNINVIHKHRYNNNAYTSGIIPSGQSVFKLWYFIKNANGTFEGGNSVYSSQITQFSNIDVALPTSISFNIPSLSTGQEIVLFWELLTASNTRDADYLNTNRNTTILFTKADINITATSTAIDSVISAHRYIDIVKQNLKAIGTTKPLTAPILESGGAFYDDFCFNGFGIRQIEGKSFETSLDEVIESFNEFAGDMQINDNDIKVQPYRDYYRDIEIGVFYEKAGIEAGFDYNEEYLINKFSIGYDKFEKERDTNETNNLDAIHTESEWYVQNDNSINEKKVKFPFVRDPFLMESTRLKVLNKETSTDSDDTIFIQECTQIAPNTTRTYWVKFKMQYTPTEVILLHDGTFDWTTAGFVVGSQFDIFTGGNTGSYTVLSIEYNLIKLTPITTIIDQTSTERVVQINYRISGVVWTNKTNEGLIFSENIQNASKYGNLNKTIKRSMLKYWNNYLATCGQFIPLKSVKNQSFTHNGAGTTQFIGETTPIREDETISISSIVNDKILSQDTYNTTVTADFFDIKDLLDKIQTLYGFIRVIRPNGTLLKVFINKLDHTWKDNELKLETLVKYEPEITIVDLYAGNIKINNEINNNFYGYSNIFNNFVQFYDSESRPLINRKLVTKIKFNGVIYDTEEELSIAIENAS